MPKGWKGDSLGHSLAARGIKSRAMPNKQIKWKSKKYTKEDDPKIRDIMIERRQELVKREIELQVELKNLDKGEDPKKVDKIMHELYDAQKKRNHLENGLFFMEGVRNAGEFFFGFNWFQPGYGEYLDRNDWLTDEEKEKKAKAKAGGTKRPIILQPKSKNIRNPDKLVDDIFYRKFDSRVPKGFFIPPVSEVARLLRNQPVKHTIENVDIFESQPQRIVVNDRNLRSIPAFYTEYDPFTRRSGIVALYPIPASDQQSEVFAQAVSHEVGHNIYNNLTQKQRADYNIIIKKSKADPISLSSIIDKREDFSQNYSLFVTGKKKIDSERETFMKELSFQKDKMAKKPKVVKRPVRRKGGKKK